MWASAHFKLRVDNHSATRVTLPSLNEGVPAMSPVIQPWGLRANLTAISSDTPKALAMKWHFLSIRTKNQKSLMLQRYQAFFLDFK